MDWIDLGQDMDEWLALVDIVINLLGPIKRLETTEWLHNWQLL
jgi:hypothetical protein